MKQVAKIVLGSQFGDEGKGIVTDYLCSRPDGFGDSSKRRIVVRFSGGQQAGHNVVIGDVSHIHSNFGSGTLRGYASYFSEYCTVYPTTIYRELQILKDKNVSPELYIHPLAKVTTPFDVAYARILDMKRGCGHTCGLGIGVTMKRNLNTGYKLFAIDLENIKMLRVKMALISQYYSEQLEVEDRQKFYELAAIEAKDFNACLELKPFSVKPYEFLTNPCDYTHQYDTIIFEGSQGILLDMDHGFFPHVTFSNTTSKNALEICKKLNITDVEIYYAARCYQTRHGHGWMSNSDTVELINTEHEINQMNDWQLDFKKVEIDYDLINYAIDIDELYHNHSNMEIRKKVVITCLDQRPDFVFDKKKMKQKLVCLGSYSPDSKDIKPLMI